MRSWGGVLIATVLFFSSLPESWAHPSPHSSIELDIRDTEVLAELTLPLVELELAFGQKLSAEPNSSLNQFEQQLKSYISSHLQLGATASEPWRVEFSEGLRVTEGESPVDLVARIRFTPTDGATPRKFVLQSDLVQHEVVNHRILVFVRSDTSLQEPAPQPRLAGMIRYLGNAIQMDRLQGTSRQVFEDAFKLGVTHILEGTDHLMFLLMLLLPAPLLADRRRWAGFAGVKPSLIHLFRTVTAFTLGHSATLVVGALGIFKLQTRPVEILIAFSVLISAIHALRPIFPGKEFWIAAGFGLIHGLAFSALIARFQIESSQLALSVLGFNLGIEFIQLALVVPVVPILIFLGRRHLHAWVRIPLAVGGVVASAWWIVERMR